MIVQVKAISVRHNGVRYFEGEEFEIDAKGYERIKTHVDVVEEDDPEKPVELDDMTVPQLREYANTNNIDLGGATKKPDILSAIRAAQNAGS
ncbi:MAG: hypothetical protein K0Q59_1781 [Paenibacillus sp.]|jgi:hypothetical protein|nr:hypothetical protein [Paenibacillus sp.]